MAARKFSRTEQALRADLAEQLASSPEFKQWGQQLIVSSIAGACFKWLQGKVGRRLEIESEPDGVFALKFLEDGREVESPLE